MSEHQPEVPDYDSTALNDLLDSTMSGMLAELEADFDPDAGLADIYARASALRQASPADATTTANARLQEVCDHIDMLDAWLAAVIGDSRARPFGGAAFLETARPVLLQLRMGLVNRTLARDDATRLIGAVQTCLDQADRVIRSQHASTLDEVMLDRAGVPASSEGTIAADVQALETMIDRLYADADHGLALVPAR